MMLFTNSTYADQESMDEMVLSNIEFAVLNGIFTYDQLNQEPQILISSEFRRSSLKKLRLYNTYSLFCTAFFVCTSVSDSDDEDG